MDYYIRSWDPGSTYPPDPKEGDVAYTITLDQSWSPVAGVKNDNLVKEEVYENGEWKEVGGGGGGGGEESVIYHILPQQNITGEYDDYNLCYAYYLDWGDNGCPFIVPSSSITVSLDGQSVTLPFNSYESWYIDVYGEFKEVNSNPVPNLANYPLAIDSNFQTIYLKDGNQHTIKFEPSEVGFPLHVSHDPNLSGAMIKNKTGYGFTGYALGEDTYTLAIIDGILKI